MSIIKSKEKKEVPVGGLAAGDVVNQFTGERWYYSDIVKEHFFNPRNLMLEEPDETQYDATGMVGSPACLAPNTLISTDTGSKKIAEVQSDDHVLSHDGEYHRIEKLFKVAYDAAHLIRIKNKIGEITATSDHLIYSKQYSGSGLENSPASWAHAGELSVGDICLYPISRQKDLAEFPIEKVERVSFAGGRLYNFEVAESHTYATNAFLVHNCGDMMKMWLKISPDGEKVQEMKWRTFGCGSAIAATSMFSVMVTENGGLALEDALKIKPTHIMERLGGLPNRKIHCSVLADKAFRKAANDYFRRTGQNSRVMIEGAKVIDAKLNITDKDIEEAVLEGAVDLESVQKKLKVGVGSPEIITEVEQLIRFYKEKYYG